MGSAQTSHLSGSHLSWLTNAEMALFWSPLGTGAHLWPCTRGWTSEPLWGCPCYAAPGPGDLCSVMVMLFSRSVV